MTVADTNVRPAWRSPAVSARGTRRFGLARLLLQELGRLLRKLDLTVLLLLAVAPTPACILPVGPEWQNPVGTPNAPPQILDPDPDWGDDASATQITPKTFKIFVTDVNVADSLHIQWIVNGRRVFTPRPTIDATGAQVRELVEKTVSCNDIFDTTLTRHTVLAVVADRELDLNVPDLFAVKDPAGEIAIAPWKLDLTCPSQ
jgi:hypothetical protein